VSWPRGRQANGKTTRETARRGHATCFSMALSSALSRQARAHLAGHHGGCHVPARRGHHRDPAERERHRRDDREASRGCGGRQGRLPVSQALAATPITLEVKSFSLT